MTATAIKKTSKAKSQSALAEDVVVIERSLANEKGIQELTTELEDELMERGVGVDGKSVWVKITLQRKFGRGKQVAQDAPFDPRAAGLELVKKLKAAEGGAWSGSQLEDLFGLTSATLFGRREARRIVFWRDAKNEFFYPRWQFTDAGAVQAEIKKVLKVFNSADEWRVMRYFLSPRRQLDGKTPLDLLRAGEIEKVVAHARNNFAEGSW